MRELTLKTESLAIMLITLCLTVSKADGENVIVLRSDILTTAQLCAQRNKYQEAMSQLDMLLAPYKSTSDLDKAMRAVFLHYELVAEYRAGHYAEVKELFTKIKADSEILRNAVLSNKPPLPIKLPCLFRSYGVMAESCIKTGDTTSGIQYLNELMDIFRSEKKRIDSLGEPIPVSDKLIMTFIQSKEPIISWLIAHPGKTSDDYLLYLQNNQEEKSSSNK